MSVIYFFRLVKSMTRSGGRRIDRGSLRSFYVSTALLLLLLSLFTRLSITQSRELHRETLEALKPEREGVIAPKYLREKKARFLEKRSVSVAEEQPLKGLDDDASQQQQQQRKPTRRGQVNAFAEDWRPFHVIHHLQNTRTPHDTLKDTTQLVRYECAERESEECGAAGKSVGDSCSENGGGFCMVTDGAYSDVNVPCVATKGKFVGKCGALDTCESDEDAGRASSVIFHSCGLDPSNSKCCPLDAAPQFCCEKEPGTFTCETECDDASRRHGANVEGECDTCETDPLALRPVACECRSFGKCAPKGTGAATSDDQCAEQHVGALCGSDGRGACVPLRKYEEEHFNGESLEPSVNVPCTCQAVTGVASGGWTPPALEKRSDADAVDDGTGGRKQLMTGKILRRLSRDAHPTTLTQGCTQIDVTVTPGLTISVGLDFVVSTGAGCYESIDAGACAAIDDKTQCEKAEKTVADACVARTYGCFPQSGNVKPKRCAAVVLDGVPDPAAACTTEEGCEYGPHPDVVDHRSTCDAVLEYPSASDNRKAACEAVQDEHGARICDYVDGEPRRRCAWTEPKIGKGRCVRRCFMAVEATLGVGFSPLSVNLGPVSLGVGTFYGHGKIAVASSEAIPCFDGVNDEDAGMQTVAGEDKKIYSFFGKNPLQTFTAKCGPHRLLAAYVYNWLPKLVRRPSFRRSMLNTLISEGNDLAVEAGAVRDLMTVTSVLAVPEDDADDAATLRSLHKHPSYNPMYLIGRVWNYKFFEPNNGLLAAWRRYKTAPIRMARRDPLASQFPDYPCDVAACGPPPSKLTCWNANDLSGTQIDRATLPGRRPLRCPKANMVNINDFIRDYCTKQSAPCDTPQAVIKMFHWFARWLLETAPIRALFLVDSASGGRKRIIADGNAEGNEYTLGDCRTLPTKEEDTISDAYAADSWRLSTVKGDVMRGPYSYWTRPRMLCSLGESVPFSASSTHYKRRMGPICEETSTGSSKWHTIRAVAGISGHPSSPTQCPDATRYFEQAPCKRVLFSTEADRTLWCGEDDDPRKAAEARAKNKDWTHARFDENFPTNYVVPLFSARVFPGLVAAIRKTSREMSAAVDSGEEFAVILAKFSGLLTQLDDELLVGDETTAPSATDTSSAAASWREFFDVLGREKIKTLDTECASGTCDRTKVQSAMTGTAFSGLDRYAAAINDWSTRQATALQKEKDKIPYDETLNYEREWAFGGTGFTLGASTVGFCTPDTNALQVTMSRRYGGVYKPRDVGVGKVVDEARATQVSVVGHPFKALPFLQLAGSVSRDHKRRRTDFEAEFKLFLFSIKQDVGGDTTGGANGAHGGADTGAMAAIATKLIAKGIDQNAVPLILYGVIPATEYLADKLRKFSQRARLSSSGKQMLASARDAVPELSEDGTGADDSSMDVDQILCGGDADRKAELEKHGAFGFRIRRLAQAGAAQVAMSAALKLVQPLNVQSYYTVSLMFESDTESNWPNFRVYLNFLTLAELTLTAAPGVTVKPEMSWGKEWDITDVVMEALESGSDAVSAATRKMTKSTASANLIDPTNDMVASEGVKICGLPTLSPGREIASDRCNMCVALTQLLFRSSNENPKASSLARLCETTCRNSPAELALCGDVASSVEILTRTNRWPSKSTIPSIFVGSTSSSNANTFDSFNEQSWKSHYLTAQCKQQTTPTPEECAAEAFCYDVFIGCLDSQNGIAV